MRPARYPLAAARAHRDQVQKAAQQQLAAAQVELAAADAIVSALLAKRDALRAQRTATVGAGAEPQSAAQIARSGAYGARLAGEQSRLIQQLSAATRVVTERARALRLAELTLIEAHGEREVIERHHARFQEEQRKLLERKHELEIEDMRLTPAARFGRD
jgi:hypothetical protein